MKSSAVSIYRWSLRVAIIAALVSLWLACGQAEAPTPTPTATPTKAPAATATPTTAVAATVTPTKAPAATATPTPVGPVATPTPTLVATPIPTPGDQPRYGGILTQVQASYTPNFDAQLLSATPEYFANTGKLYTNLLVNYQGSNIECEVCSEWHLENNGKTMVFTLIPGIKFHNGQEMTSADVVYSLKMIIGEIDGLVSSRAGALKEYVQSIEAPSKYEVRLNLLRPSPFVPKILSVAAAVIYRNGTTRDALNKADSGAGPFIVKRLIGGAGWELERYPDYFKKGQPYLDGYKTTVVVDLTTRAAAIVTGNAHLDRYNLDIKQFEPQFLALESQGKLKRYYDLGACGINQVMMNNAKPPFNNLKMRQALNLALDRTDIANVSFGANIAPWVPQLLSFEPRQEFGTPAEKIWNVVPGWGTGVKKQQEIEQAKQLVKDAGYTSGIDNVDQMISGYTTYPQESHDLIQQELAQVGIRTKFSFSPAVAQREQRLSNLDYTTFYYLVCVITRDPDEAIGGYFLTGGARNWFGYTNPEVDKLYVQMSSELDPVKRKELFYQIQDIIVVKDVALAPTPASQGLIWVSAKVHGYALGLSLHSGSGLARSDRLWLKD
ncbi:MAG: ABC transporter substrate-binding protein [Dehalococcoidia bacterium]|nr:ABC transporter substrate-binding protein [Dehalococcoidia bacterium]